MADHSSWSYGGIYLNQGSHTGCIRYGLEELVFIEVALANHPDTVRRASFGSGGGVTRNNPYRERIYMTTDSTQPLYHQVWGSLRSRTRPIFKQSVTRLIAHMILRQLLSFDLPEYMPYSVNLA